MKIIAVDDESLALENILSMLKRMFPKEEITGYRKTSEALEYLQANQTDIAFLDIEMGEMDGITMAKKCKDACPDINIIFITGYEQYAMDAWRLHASGYLLKPVREKDMLAEISHLRSPMPVKPVKRVRVQTFGNFEVFVDNKPVFFQLAKCKECLAYLIDRKGARITAAQLAAVLWEREVYDRKVQNNTHRVLSDLMKSLNQAGIADIVIKTRRDICIDMEKVDCDYYGFLKGEVPQINAFHGEYMTDYSWAEFTLAEIVMDSGGRGI